MDSEYSYLKQYEPRGPVDDLSRLFFWQLSRVNLLRVSNEGYTDLESFQDLFAM